METPFDYLETTINGVSLSDAYILGFKAGQEDVKSGVVCADCIRHVLRDGRREVVDFITEHIFPLLNMSSVSVGFKDRWNSKLKEWKGE